MIRIVVAAVAFSLLSAAASGQSAPARSVVTIHVMDATGAVIPHAMVRATSAETGSIIDATTDSAGRAALELPAGNYTASISARGFKGFIGHFQAPDEPGKWFDARLEVAEETSWGPCCVPAGPELPIENPVLTAFIPFAPLVPLNALPAKRVHRHHSHWL